MSSAGQRVFSVAELVNIILAYIDFYDQHSFLLINRTTFAATLPVIYAHPARDLHRVFASIVPDREDLYTPWVKRAYTYSREGRYIVFPSIEKLLVLGCAPAVMVVGKVHEVELRPHHGTCDACTKPFLQNYIREFLRPDVESGVWIDYPEVPDLG